MAFIEDLSKRPGYERMGTFDHKYTLGAEYFNEYDGRIHHPRMLDLFEGERLRIFEGRGIDVFKIAKELGIVGVVTDAVLKLRGGELIPGQEVNLVTDVFSLRNTLLAFHHKIPVGDAVPVQGIIDIAIMNVGNPNMPRMNSLPPDIAVKLRPAAGEVY